jgi:hypothetical protein
MSASLWIASHWMPSFIMVREIERIRASTNEALNALLSVHAPDVRELDGDVKGHGPAELRSAMAMGHDRKVRALVRAVGRDRAIKLGREALFQTGLELGREAKVRLKVKESKGDLVRAAGVLYRLMDIDFIIVNGPEGERLEVSRCALSVHYSHETCLILSSVDEGAISGLNPRAKMVFGDHITGGSPKCLARIEMEEEG